MNMMTKHEFLNLGVFPTRAHRKITGHEQCFRYLIQITSDLPLGFHCVSKKQSSRDQTLFPQWIIVACINDLRIYSPTNQLKRLLVTKQKRE